MYDVCLIGISEQKSTLASAWIAGCAQTRQTIVGLRRKGQTDVAYSLTVTLSQQFCSVATSVWTPGTVNARFGLPANPGNSVIEQSYTVYLFWHCLF